MSKAQIGHNSGGTVRSFVMRIERLNDVRKEATDDLRAVYAQARECGLDTHILRKLVWLRDQNPMRIESEEAALELYRNSRAKDGRSRDQ